MPIGPAFQDVDNESLTTALNQAVALGLDSDYRFVSAAGVSPGAINQDNVLAVFSVPANAFGALVGEEANLVIEAVGSFGATANNKRLKIIAGPSAAVVGSAVTGGTTIADSGTVATNGGGWSIRGRIVKYGAVGSNTQLGINIGAVAGAVYLGVSPPVALTLNENAAFLIAIVGNATTVVGDIKLNFVEIDGMA